MCCKEQIKAANSQRSPSRNKHVSETHSHCRHYVSAVFLHAWLNCTDAEEEPLFIARALLPEEIDEGTKLKYEIQTMFILLLHR